MSTAQVTARLGADATSFKSVLSDAETHAGKVAGGLAKKFELRNLGQTMATALGLNLQSMAEAVARFVTGMSEEMDRAFAAVVDSSNRARDAVIAGMRAQASEETKLQLLLLERERIQNRLATGKASPDAAIGTSWLAGIKTSLGAMLGFDGTGQLREEVQAQVTASLNQDAARLAQLDGEIAKAEGDREKNATAAGEARAKWVNSLQAGVSVLGEINAAENEQLTTSEQITDQVDEQNKKLAEQKQYRLEISRIGREDADLSDRELERKVRNLREGIAATTRSNVSDPNIAKFLNQPAELELQKLQGELNLRQQVRQSAARFGEDRAFQQFNLSEQRFAEILRGQTEQSEQTKLLRRIDEKFETGIRTIVLNP